MSPNPQTGAPLRAFAYDSPAAWRRLALCVLVSAIGGVGMWSIVVALPAVQTEFNLHRAGASAPYTLTMISFAIGGVWMGRLADLHGIVTPLILGAVFLCAGYLLSAFAPNIFFFTLAQGVFIGLGASASLGPLAADISRWFQRRRGLAVAICFSGNYVAGAVWPPVVQHFVAFAGWRAAHIGIGLFCLLTLPALALVLKKGGGASEEGAENATLPIKLSGFSPNALQALLAVAGFACCVAMAMPQVHIVAYCSDLGYGAARGAEMLAIMLALGIVSRIAAGFIADHIGGVATLLVSSFLQGVALFLYLLTDALPSLYAISALFGLFQGGIVPCYAIIVREYFSSREAGARVGVVIMATLFGMAFGGWASGALFDATGSYRAAFVNGIFWNLLNVSIASLVLFRRLRMQKAATL